MAWRLISKCSAILFTLTGWLAVIPIIARLVGSAIAWKTSLRASILCKYLIANIGAGIYFADNIF